MSSSDPGSADRPLAELDSSPFRPSRDALCRSRIRAFAVAFHNQKCPPTLD
jgi:hypothetical protein